MIRQTIVSAIRESPRINFSTFRTISYTATRMGEGDTGGVRSGGAASADAFSKRETASESKYVKEKEMEKLAALKEKIKAQRKHLEELDSYVDNQMGSKDN